MIDFPNSPTVGQTFSVNGKSWKWTGVYWQAILPEAKTTTVVTQNYSYTMWAVFY